MRKSYFCVLAVTFCSFYSVHDLAEARKRAQERAGNPQPIEVGIVEESPYAKPYLPDVIVGKNQQGWRCDKDGNPDQKNIEGHCYDINDGTFRFRTTLATGRGAIESVFKIEESKPVFMARFDRKNERNQNALISESPAGRQYAAAKGGTSVAGESKPGSQDVKPEDAGKSAIEGALSKALGSILPKLPK